MKTISNVEKARSLCCSGCNKYQCYTDNGSCVNLKNLIIMAEWKDKQHEQEKQQWSEEDGNIIDDLIQTISQYTVFAHREPKEIIQWLKSLKSQPNRKWREDEKEKITNLKTFIARCKGFNKENMQKAFDMIDSLKPQPKQEWAIEQLTAFAVHLNKRGAFRDDLCMDFEHEAQSFIEMQNNKEL